MFKKPILSPGGATALVATTLLLAAGCGGSGPTREAAPAPADAAQSAQHVTVRTRDTGLVVKGVDSLRPGFVRFGVRNEGHREHGIELVRLKRPLTSAQLVQAFEAEKRGLFEALGGIQQVLPGRPWEMTERLGTGSYALLDFAQNGSKPNYAHGLYTRFEVGRAPDQGKPPATVGTIDMRDFSFEFRLPQGFSGRGVVKITNAGKTSHEISLVRIEPGHTQREVLSLIIGGSTRPPEWASVVELLSVLDPTESVYVRFDLRPGRYVALCLMNEPGSQALHAQLGMIDSFDVT